MTGLKEIMQSPGPVFDFIERISKKEGAHKTSFNGSMYTETPRPVYNVPEPKRIRPLIDDMNFMTLKRLKKY